MEPKKEYWINDTLSSTDGKKSVKLPVSLKQRLQSIPEEVVIYNKVIPMRSVWLAAASLALLFSVNILAIRKVQQTKKQESTFYTEYFSYLEQL